MDLTSVNEFYHGSPVTVKFPDVFYNRPNRDFGRGFYSFANRDDAYSWALHKQRAERSPDAFVNRYELKNASGLTCHVFNRDCDTDLLRWIDFVAYNREYHTLVSENPLGNKAHDVIVGPVANGYLGESFQLLFSGAIPGRTWEERKRRFMVLLEHDRLSDQYCFKTKEAERKLRFIGADRCYS